VIFAVSICYSATSNAAVLTVKSGSPQRLTTTDAAVLLTRLDCSATARIRVSVNSEEGITVGNLQLYGSTKHTDFKPRDFLFECNNRISKLPKPLSHWSSTINHKQFKDFVYSYFKIGRAKISTELEDADSKGVANTFKFRTELFISVAVSDKIHRLLSKATVGINGMSDSFEDRISKCSSRSSASSRVEDLLDFFTYQGSKLEKQIKFLLQVDKALGAANNDLLTAIKLSNRAFPGMLNQTDVLEIDRAIREFQVTFFMAIDFVEHLKNLQDNLYRIIDQSDLREFVEALEALPASSKITDSAVLSIAREEGLEAKILKELAAVAKCKDIEGIRFLAKYAARALKDIDLYAGWFKQVDGDQSN